MLCKVLGSSCCRSRWSGFILFARTNTACRFRYYSSPRRKPVSPDLPKNQLPHITIIRPVKGLEPELYACLASTFRQSYPASHLHISLCVSSEDDPAYPTLEKIAQDFSSTHDVRIFVEEYDPMLSSLDGTNLGPNPKIRNISRAYREAKGDLIWIIDCNVWISRGVAGRMVDRLMGFLPDGQRTTPFRFVHHMPLVVDIPPSSEATGTVRASETMWKRIWRTAGGRLDAMFFTTTHAKFYGAINTVGVAPCIIGKSNMFRKSHLDKYTDPTHNHNLPPASYTRGTGVDFFSNNICEDHLIGELLWKADIPGHSKHGLVWGDICVQPVCGVSVGAYWGRRVRWLRARKWTVLVATLVEPGVESLLCNFLFAYAATTLPFFHTTFGIPRTWSGTLVGWALGVGIWAACDRAVYRRLHRLLTVEVDEDTPAFARGVHGLERMPLREWLPTWLGRELLAFPIWTWAVLLGSTITWRGKAFKVRSDMSVVSLDEGLPVKQNGHAVEGENGRVVEQEDKHPDMQTTPQWKGRPTARQRKSRTLNLR